MHKNSVCIIGSGIGGMTAGIRLANKGYNVVIFEKENRPGGKASVLEFERFRFDTGPSLLTMKEVVEQLFLDIGEDISNYLKINRLDILCRYFFRDGSIINAYGDFNRFLEEVNSVTGEDDKTLIKYFKYNQKIFDGAADIFLYNSDKGIKNFLNIKSLKTLLNINKIDPFRTMHETNKNFFRSEKLVQIFDRYATYNGSNPYSAPATLNIISHIENSMGGYYFEGGMRSLTEALYKIALKKGVEFRFGEKVVSLEKKGTKIISLITEKSKYTFDYYISNTDALTTDKYILGEDIRINENNISSSALVFYWGAEGTFENLETHNILFAGNYKKEFEDLFENRKFHNDPTIYIYISSKFCKTDAPPDYSNLFVMINSPADFGQDWDAESKLMKDIILDKIKSITGNDLHNKIKSEKIMSPKTLREKTGSYRGSIYGYSSNSKFSAFLRKPNKSRKYKNLFYCGGSSHPGGGIPLVMLSGRNAAEKILRSG